MIYNVIEVPDNVFALVPLRNCVGFLLPMEIKLLTRSTI